MSETGGAGVPECFCCVECGTPITGPVVRLPRVPGPRPDVDDEDRSTAPSVPAGQWAFDTEPAGWTLRDREHFNPDELPGIDAWRPSGLWNCPVLNVADLLDLPPHPDGLRSSGCCGRDGLDGPNLVCPTCEAPVATVTDDCWTPQEVRLEPHRVIARRLA